VARSLPATQVQALAQTENKVADTPVCRRLVLSPRAKNVTANRLGQFIAIVGVPVRKLPEDEET
jgi:hypothetical protein